MREQCYTRFFITPSTCTTSLKVTQEYQCQDTVMQETCATQTIMHQQTCYEEREITKNYECPSVSSTRRCITEHPAVPTTCSATLSQAVPVSCKGSLTVHQCNVEVGHSTERCYRTDAIERPYTCYNESVRQDCISLKVTQADQFPTRAPPPKPIVHQAHPQAPKNHIKVHTKHPN
eukprot:GHVT01058554.1.p1 GENE.GHVT01058554.1~~GHVT01058554.1.p1  ORF type:complete len:176 (-),score=15.27 GHVT01058554.1:206-733(-)